MLGDVRMRATALAAAMALVAALGGCTGPVSHREGAPLAPPASPSAAPATPGPAATPDTSCGDATASLRPQPGPLPAPGAFPAGSQVRAIYDRGKLIAGVAEDSLLFGYLNPINNELEGFDIDLVKQVSRAIFGDENHVEYRLITTAQRIPMIVGGQVDVVAFNFTINCARWKQIAFSSAYYHAGQRVLVSKSSPANGIQDLAGKRVCAPAASTSIDNIARAPGHPVPVAAPDPTDCLVLLQRGQVDAISTDDTVLLGLTAQDQSMKVVGPKFTDEPYGIGMALTHPDLVRFVNAVLERMRTDGTWTTNYNRWLAPYAPGATPPPATYRD